jgi:peptidoglycan/xylan/chitin deacetylase (PgdA/CDA1 family)
LRRRYRVVAASNILEAAGARRRGGRFPVAITFDDDLDSHVREATPMLRSAGLPATFFLCGASLADRSTFWWEALQIVVDRREAPPATIPLVDSEDVGAAFARVPFAIHRVAKVVESLPPEQRKLVTDELVVRIDDDHLPAAFGPDRVQALVAAGFELGFHTRDHYVLTGLDRGELAGALHSGREELGSTASQRLELLAYPHGKADGRVAAAAKEAGFTLAFCGSRDVVTPATHPFLIGRIEPRANTPGRFALELARALHHSRRRRALA